MGEQTSNDPGCDGRVVTVSETMVVSGAYLQLRGHQSAATSGEQEISDHGEDMEESHEQRKGKSTGLCRTKKRCICKLLLDGALCFYPTVMITHLVINPAQLTIRPVARKGYGSIAHEAKPNGLLIRGL